MKGQLRSPLMFFVVVVALLALAVLLTSCITIERVQVGPDRWPGESGATTQSTAEIERKIWEDLE